MKRKIAFLFGAGAEEAYCICNGKEFAKEVLSLNNENSKTQIIDSAIQKHYKNILETCDNREWYPCYHNMGFRIGQLLENTVKKKSLDENKFTKNKKDFDKQIKDSVEALKESLNCSTTDESELSANKEIREIIESCPNYMGILDERFHTLISPQFLGPHKFWSVIILYTRAYLAVSLGVLGYTEISEECILNILGAPDKTQRYIREIIQQDERFGIESYYSILRNYIGSELVAPHHNNYFILSMNYTPIGELITGLDQQNFAYLHGKLSWFESPYNLQVYDVLDKEEMEQTVNSIVFPYIFVQSGIKPIVERKQLGEYAKMLQALDEADVLFIVGYGINGDDNHVNSLLHSYLKGEEKTIVYLDFANALGKKKLLQRLRFDRDMGNLLVHPVYSGDALDKFKELIEAYQ